MPRGRSFLLLLVFAGVCSGAFPIAPPSFEKGHYARGALHIPRAKIVEPFDAWHDPQLQKSRIDYYDGMVKTYQSSGDYGYTRKIIPVSTEKKMNDMKCWEKNGYLFSPVETQSVFPEMTGYQFAGQEVINGVLCNKWKNVGIWEGKSSRYTIWIKAEESNNSTAVVVPVRFEVIGILNVMEGGGHDHYYLDYETYQEQTPNATTFDTPPGIYCSSYLDVDSSLDITFNPMREFVHGDERHVEEEFRRFRRTHSRSYSDDEHARRKQVFRQNLRFIHSKNRAGLGFSLAVNHLADRTEDERRALRGRRQEPTAGGPAWPCDPDYADYADSLPDDPDVPETLDWRERGAVSPVRDQSMCGSCWALSTTAVVEGAHFLKHGELLHLSPQALIDCSWGFGNFGCDGGFERNAYKWMMKHGLPTEADYGPYLAQDGFCRMDEVKAAANVSEWGVVPSGDERALKAAVAKWGPVAVSMNASPSSGTLDFYAGGVFYDETCYSDRPNHSVLLVGYGKLGDRPYWLVKNSWSTYWGIEGYFLISSTYNNCGITSNPTFVKW